MSMSPIPTIIVFDVGNVLIEWNMRHVYRRIFNDDASMEKFFEETNLMAWNLEQDRGRAWQEAEELLIVDFPHYEHEIRAFRAQWHDMVPGAIIETVELHQALAHAGVPLYAITNFASDTFEEVQQRFPFLRGFIDIVVSAEENLVKPDAAIYQRLLNRNNLKAADCLFIDDSEINIAGARAVGMVAHHFSSAKELKVDLRKYGFAV